LLYLQRWGKKQDPDVVGGEENLFGHVSNNLLKAKDAKNLFRGGRNSL